MSARDEYLAALDAWRALGLAAVEARVAGFHGEALAMDRTTHSTQDAQVALTWDAAVEAEIRAHELVKRLRLEWLKEVARGSQ